MLGPAEEEEGAVEQWEPEEGMEFESEEAAKQFYAKYAQRVGVCGACNGLLVLRERRSKAAKIKKLGIKPKKRFRGGCKAMIRVKCDRSGKWVLTNFLTDHNHHPLEGSKFVSRRQMGFRSLAEGESVEYTVGSGDDGRAKAVDVSGPEGAPVQRSRGGGGGGRGRGGGGYGGRYGDLLKSVEVELAELCEAITSAKIWK
ncbi:hypothetical protein QQ045_006523 [Rhodiola kirilowii]